MGKIKGWKKENDYTWSQVITRPVRFGNPKKRIWVMVTKDRFGKPVLLIHKKSGLTESHKFKTKKEAMKAATAWMRRHPNG